MDPNKNISDSNNSSLADCSTSIHLDDELFISSPKNGTVKTPLIIENKNVIPTPILPKNQRSPTVFINCEYNSSNDMLEKNNISQKNLLNINLIYVPDNNLENDEYVNKNKLKKFKTFNVKKIEKDKDIKSITEKKKKNTKSKLNKENTKLIKLDYYKNEINNIRKNQKRLSTREFTNFTGYLNNFREINNNNNFHEKRKTNKILINQSEKNAIKIFKDTNCINQQIYDENEKNEKKKENKELKSSSFLCVYLKNNKEVKRHSTKIYHSQKIDSSTKKFENIDQIDEKLIKRKQESHFKTYKKQNSLFFKMFKNNENKKIKKDEKLDNNIINSQKIPDNFYIINQESEDINNKNNLLKSHHHLFSFDIKKYKNSNWKNRYKNYKYNNKMSKSKSIKKEIKNDNILLKDKKPLSKKFTLDSNIQNRLIDTRDTTLMYSKSISSTESNKNLDEILINSKNNIKRNTIIKISEEDIESYSNKEKIENFYEYLELCLETIIDLDIKSQPRCKSEINFNFPKHMKNKKIALFDLDETLIHCVGEIKPGLELKYDHKIEVNLPNRKAIIGINERPFWRESLDMIKNDYNIVIYTASHNSYSDAILNYLDKDNKYFPYRLYRNSCVQCTASDGMKFYVKDLDIFKKYYDLKNIIIIDNSVLSFTFHLNNGIPVVPYIDSKEDKELKLVALYLLSIVDCDNVCTENIKHFQLEKHLEIAKNNIENESLSYSSDNENETEKKDSTPIIKIIENENNYSTDKHKTSIMNINNIISSNIILKEQLNVNNGEINAHKRNSCIFNTNKNILDKLDYIFYLFTYFITIYN